MMVAVVCIFGAGGRGRLARMLLSSVLLSILTFFSVAAQTACPPDACLPILAARISFSKPEPPKPEPPKPEPPKPEPPKPDPDPEPPTPEPPALPVPTFTPQGGNLAYGSVIQLSADNVPAGAEIEYSWDGGANWIKGNQTALYTSGKLKTRTRLNDRVSDQTEADYAPYYRKVFILGNSITQISEAPSLGWFGNWGMAASAPDKDYVHRLTDKLKERYDGIQVKLISGGGFERNHWDYDYEDQLDKHIREFGSPDLIIVRIAENVNESLVVSNDFKGHYQTLLNHLTQYSGAVRVVCTTSFFVNQPMTNSLIKEVANERGYPVADIATLAGKAEYKPAPGTFPDSGVADHPGDAGMQAIADLIWERVR